ncbi:amidohydrolase [Variovorax sp. RB3P1]|uniref:amidohydrolase n=1 Tax=Variovorax sp. RB3P1 TaxID=3443732 RepID=UPI003F46011D
MSTQGTRGTSTVEPHVLQTTGGFHEFLRVFRQDLHAHPELGFQELRTAGLVAQALRRLGLDEVHTGVGRTGVVGVLRGNSPGHGKSVGLRADMDALPIHEAGDCAHRSVHPGLMHGCGHDGHVAMLLGAARYLATNRNFRGTVNFIFQPGEEGYAGAREMIDDGLFDRFPTDAVYALHNWPSLPAGMVAVNPSAMMAARDDFWIRIEGAGGHGAMPHRTVDPVVTAAAVITALQSVVSRNIDPASSAVLTLHSMRAGTAIEPGIPTQSVTVPPHAEIAGIAKWFDQTTGNLLKRRLAELAQGCAGAFGARAQVEYLQFLPPTVNHAACAEVVRRAAVAMLGAEQVLTGLPPSMASEDFSFMLQSRPGAYFWLGVGENSPSLHSPLYDFNDAVLPVGAALLATIAQDALAT